MFELHSKGPSPLERLQKIHPQMNDDSKIEKCREWKILPQEQSCILQDE